MLLLVCLIVYLCMCDICLFMHLYVYPFLRPCVRALARSFVCPSVRPCVCSFVRALVRPFACVFVGSFDLLFV